MLGIKKEHRQFIRPFDQQTNTVEESQPLLRIRDGEDMLEKRLAFVEKELAQFEFKKRIEKYPRRSDYGIWKRFLYFEVHWFLYFEVHHGAARFVAPWRGGAERD